MLKKTITFLFLIACLPIIVLAAMNSEPVEVNYFFGTFSIRLSWLVVAAFVLGVIAMVPFFAMTGYYWKSKAKKLKQEIDAIHKDREKEIIAEKYQKEKS